MEKTAFYCDLEAMGLLLENLAALASQAIFEIGNIGFQFLLVRDR